MSEVEEDEREVVDQSEDREMSDASRISSEDEAVSDDEVELQYRLDQEENDINVSIDSDIDVNIKEVLVRSLGDEFQEI